MAPAIRALIAAAATLAFGGHDAFAGGADNHDILECEPVCKGARWEATGPLNVARDAHTATLLPDGRVLVTGGRNPSWPSYALDSVEIFDPATGTWSLGPPMSVPRAMHTATSLADGRVLVTGGIRDQSGAGHASAEIFDPTAQTWSHAGAMNEARSWHAATRLADGRVLVSGGWNGNGAAGTELYDPGAGTWRVTGDLVVRRYGHTMTRLDDGTVLLAGGSNSGDLQDTLHVTELYDPAEGRSHRVGDAFDGGVMQPATRLPDGGVLLTGGNGGGVGGSAVFGGGQRFDPHAHAWIRTAPMAGRRYGHTATLLANGHVLVVGGENQHSAYPTLSYETLRSTERYDPANERWEGSADLDEARAGHTATALADGTVLVAGGDAVNGYYAATSLASAAIYRAAGVPRLAGRPGTRSPLRATP